MTTTTADNPTAELPCETFLVRLSELPPSHPILDDWPFHEVRCSKNPLHTCVACDVEEPTKCPHAFVEVEVYEKKEVHSFTFYSSLILETLREVIKEIYLKDGWIVSFLRCYELTERKGPDRYCQPIIVRKVIR